jgi:Uma2 family endonuclease
MEATLNPLELVDPNEFRGGVRKYPNFVPVIPEGATPEDDEYYIVHYEESMSEVPAHYWQKEYLGNALKAAQPERWVVGECCLYLDRAEPTRFKVPDILITRGAPNTEKLRTYVLWRDPAVVFVAEVLSDDNTQAEVDDKQVRYERAGILEFLVVDPEACRFTLYELHRGGYRAVAPNAHGRCWSQELGIWFGADEDGFVWVYGQDGRRSGTYLEERTRAEQERSRAEQERTRAEQERTRAEQERSRAEAAEAQVAELLARLKAMEPPPD